MALQSLARFLEGASQVGAAQTQGTLAGEDEARQIQQQQMAQALQFAQAEQARQQQQAQTLLAAGLSPQSKADVLGTLGAQSDPWATLANSPLAQRNPALRALHSVFGGGQPPALPATAPPVASAGVSGAPMAGAPMPAGAPGNSPLPGAAPPVPGMSAQLSPAPGTAAAPSFGWRGKTLSLQGWNPKAAEIMLRHRDDMEKAAGQIDWSVNPNAKQTFEAANATAPRQILSQEDFDQLQHSLSSMDSAINTMGGRFGQALQERRGIAQSKLLQTTLFDRLPQMDDLTAAGAFPQLLDQEREITKSGGISAGLEARADQIEQIRQKLAAGDQDGAAQIAHDVRQGYLAKASPARERVQLQDVTRRLNMLDPTKVTPDVVRAIYDKAKLGYLVDDLPDEALQYGGAAVFRQAQSALRDLRNWKDLNPAAQKAALDNLTYLSKASGEPVEVPAEIVSQMTPSQKAQVALAGKRIQIASRNADTAKARNEIAQGQLDLSQARFDWMKQHPPRGAAGTGAALSANQQAAALYRKWNADAKEVDRLYAKGGPLYGRRADFDPAHPNPGDKQEVNSAKLINDTDAELQDYQDYVFKRGPYAAPAKPGAPGAAAAKPGAAQAAPSGYTPAPSSGAGLSIGPISISGASTPRALSSQLDAQKKSLDAESAALNALGQRAQTGDLSLDEQNQYSQRVTAFNAAQAVLKRNVDAVNAAMKGKGGAAAAGKAQAAPGARPNYGAMSNAQLKQALARKLMQGAR